MESGAGKAADVNLALTELELLTRGIQDSVMAIRAQPVKSVFQRMPRLVREVGEATHKRVRLVTEGEGTEVDKTVVEKLSDPITHMIRNAIDHGLETPAEREAAGKPAEGVVRLTAAHRSGRIVIEVSDDGRGVDRVRVKAKAIEKGLIAADAQMTDEEIDNLIDRHVAPDLLLPLESDPIAVAGTATTLAAIELGLPGYDSAKIHGQRVRRDAIATWIAKLAPLTAEQRRAAHPAIEIGRAPVIIGGALVLLAMLDALHADAYIASERDILHGLALGLAA
jgi:hypothetical protein